MANRAAEELARAAEELRLTIIGQEYSRKHLVIYVRNELGAICRRTVSRSGSIGGHDCSNMRGELKRFARGQYHGLRVTNAQGL